jgi:hypothetical protein
LDELEAEEATFTEQLANQVLTDAPGEPLGKSSSVVEKTDQKSKTNEEYMIVPVSQLFWYSHKAMYEELKLQHERPSTLSLPSGNSIFSPSTFSHASSTMISPSAMDTSRNSISSFTVSLASPTGRMG